jgi:hypothetical protein
MCALTTENSPSPSRTSAFLPSALVGAATLYNDPRTVKLFYQEHHKYACHSQNWGASKGIDRYRDVWVVLNPGNVKAWHLGSFRGINVQTRNKLYVCLFKDEWKPYVRS